MDNFVGEMTKHVVSKAPCQVILTAPPADDQPSRRESDERRGGKADGDGDRGRDDGPADQSISARPPLREQP
jgi:APA family basic amino acid/polyamine antiporter